MDSADETFRTVCPRNCYCTCGMMVTVRDGKIVRIEGDPDNPATGGRVCLKGLSYARRVTAPNRLTHPLIRRRDRQGFERISWDAALNGIGEALARLRQDPGPESVLYYHGSGSHGALEGLAMAFWHSFGGCSLTYGDLCWPAGLEATRLTYGANRHNHPRLTPQSRFVLVWGHNPAETNVHQMRLIQDAQDQGATLAVIDPRSTDTTDAADLHLQPRPGTDAALALGVARVIVKAALHDQEFLRAHATGIEAYLENLDSYPLDRVSALTGVPERLIEELALGYARGRPALLIAGFGLQRTHHAGQTMRAVCLLPALTGNVGTAGGGWQYANLASHCLRPLPLPPEPPRVRRAIPISRLGRGLTETVDPPIRAIWVERGNPASQNPRALSVKQALEGLDLVVVVDQFMTDTAALADFVLPAKSLFEEEDLVTAYWHPYLQLRTRILDPPGEVKTETEIWQRLCRHFGFGTGAFPNGSVHEWLRKLLPEDRPELLEELAEGPVDPSPAGEVAFADGRFATPSGKIEFSSEQAARLWGVEPVPTFVPLEEGSGSALAERFPLQLLTCKTRERIHSQFGNVDWVRDAERIHRLDIHPEDAGRRGLGEGDVALVWNDRGRIEIAVHLDHGIRPGVVHILEGRSHRGDPEVNLLTDDGVTDMGHGATFYECLVEVARA